MPSASSTPRIFVSHSHHDNALGLRLVADLREQLGDYAVWYDASGGLRGGDEWWKTIVAEITASDTFLVILSPDALASDWVPREMAIAYLQHVRQGKRLLPLTYRPCKLSADWELIQSLPISDPATDPAAYAHQRDNLLAALGISSTATAPQPAIPVRPAHPAQAHPALNPTDMVPAFAQQPDSARTPQHESFLGRMSRTAVASSPAVAQSPTRIAPGKPKLPRRPLIAGVAALLVVASLGALLLRNVPGSPFANNGTPTATRPLSAVGPWKVAISPTQSDISSISMVSADDGWAVGKRGTILHYTGSQWVTENSPTSADLLSVVMDSATDGWAVGRSGTILHYTGGQWTSVTWTPPIGSLNDYDLHSVALVSATEGWAVGDSGESGTILHYAGGKWQGVNTSGYTDIFLSVAMDSATEGWAVGAYGMIWHYSGGQWTGLYAQAGDNIYSVAMATATSGWAVGANGAIWDYIGGQWGVVGGPTNSNLNSVAMDSATVGWAVGNSGTILHYTAGSWSAVRNVSSNLILYGVAMVSSHDGWAVGSGGTILHYTGGQ